MSKLTTIFIAVFLAISIILLVKYQGITASATEIPDYACGDGKCTIPLEDKITCPQDCLVDKIDPFPYFLGGLFLLLIGIFYFNFYRGRADLRKLTKGKNPFKSQDHYKRVYKYIDSALNINMDKTKIINNLYHKGWTKKQVHYTFDDVTWKQRKVLLETPPKVTPNIKPLEEYIQRCRTVNLPDNQIKTTLLKKGWKRSHVRKAFRNLAYK